MIDLKCRNSVIAVRKRMFDNLRNGKYESFRAISKEMGVSDTTLASIWSAKKAYSWLAELCEDCHENKVQIVTSDSLKERVCWVCFHKRLASLVSAEPAGKSINRFDVVMVP